MTLHMKRTMTIIAAAFVIAAQLSAQEITVSSFRHAGPYPVAKPYAVDTVDIAGKAYDASGILDRSMSFESLKSAAIVDALPECGTDAIHLLGFSTQNTLFTKATVKLSGLRDYRIYMDGKKIGSEVKMEPGTHDFVVKYLSAADTSAVRDTFKITVTPDREGKIVLREDGRHIYDLDYNTIGVQCGGTSLSPGGRYMTVTHSIVKPDGKGDSYTEILNTADASFVARSASRVEWMPAGDRIWYTRQEVDGRTLICRDPKEGQETVLARNIPEGYFTIAPTEDFLIYHMTQEGPKEGDVHQVLTPDDRQPGWRDRSYLAKYDLASGVLQPLTFGWHNSWLADISSDGKHMLFSTDRARLTKRPTSLRSVYQMDLATLETECIIEDDGFIGSVSYSPDGKRIAVTGGPESFGGIGKDVKEGQIPNQYDGQMFVMDIATKKVDPVTKRFAPSVQNVSWSRADGKIYFIAEDKDCKHLFRMDPDSGKTEMMDCGEDNISSFDLSDKTNDLIFRGQSLCNGDRAYVMDVKKGKRRLLYDFSAERLDGVDLGEGLPYEFTSSRGDLINAFYVLPPDFDASRKYPLLVHYYGGCSPTARYCIGSYSPQVYAAQGYIFLVVNPSGAAGFGQEFAARHVNTAGDVVADDIIEATKRFCEDHPYVDSKHIGCFSASYGGFMTQLLLSKTDIYTTGISHAGISDHTSYWGEGYWGYSYSEISMADSYPWTRKDLYVDRSPLYNADKIHTPLLFLHGSADTNVPIGESIQMFTALKLLGQETAFVVVDGENHGIREFEKRRQWLRTIFAWFSKYLQEDDTWWNELYPEKNL